MTKVDDAEGTGQEGSLGSHRRKLSFPGGEVN